MTALMLTALGAGLLGGVHCIAMCGGIVGAITLRKSGAKVPLSSQLQFNAGRVGSYGLAGALAGGLGAGFAVSQLLPIQIMLFVMANGMVVLLGLYIAGQGRAVLLLERVGARLWPLVRRLSRRFPDTSSATGRLAAGAVWGWTPCGLAYSMMTLALVSGGAAQGAAIMLLFGAGTLPNLLASGWLMSRFGAQLKRPATRLAAGLAISVFGVAGLIRSPELARHIREGLLCLDGQHLLWF